MDTLEQLGFTIADRIWIATALLHQEFPSKATFNRDEIRRKLALEGLDGGIKSGSINAHLSDHLVANVPASSGKYRMLFEESPGNLRLFRPGDLTHPSRVQRRRPSKSIPNVEQIPMKYRRLLEWYEMWSKRLQRTSNSWQDDPLIRLIGSGKHIWADEHADEYVNRLREEPA